MKIPFHLRRRPAGHPATALLVPGPEASAILSLCARIGLDPRGRIFAVAGGWLLQLDRPDSGSLPDGIRLRKLAHDLLIPVDAELLPALRDDEAAGMTRDHGLIFLPGGEVLGYAPHSPVAVSSLLICDVRPRRDWRPLPEPPRLADRIEEIRFERPEDTSEGGEGGMFDAGPTEGETSHLRPPAAGPAPAAMGRAALGLGRGMMWLGKKLNLKGLAALGAKWVRSAMDLAPRLGEDVLGKQAAALRELLREFREGDPERALSRALPLGEPGGPRGAGFDQGDRLSTRDTRYDLEQLLKGDGRDGARVWLGGQEVMDLLLQEYRRAAEKALQKGDHRRAAFIFGKLLRDFHMAAHALMRGGLYRDAAALFLGRLDNPTAAALALEAAGEIDRAIQLYRRVREHEAAANLLRKIGEEDEAVREYLLAADRLAATPAGHLAAGDLLRDKAGRADLALGYYQAGWDRRPGPHPIACASRIAQHHAEAGRPAPILDLVEEAQSFLATGVDDGVACKFFEDIALLADASPKLADAREEIRDRALIGMAAVLRRNAHGSARPKVVISKFLGNLRAWPPALVRDAEQALAAAARVATGPPPALSPTVDRLGLGAELVTASTFSPETDEVFFGFHSGEVVGFRPRNDELFLVAGQGLPVEGLSVSENGRHLVVLQQGDTGDGRLTTFERKPDGSYRTLVALPYYALSSLWLTPVLQMPSGHALIGSYDGRTLSVLEVARLTPRLLPALIPEHADPVAAVLIPGAGALGYDVVFQLGDGWKTSGQLSSGTTSGFLGPIAQPITPAVRNVAMLRTYPDQFELAWIGPYGTIYWGLLRVAGDDMETINRATSAQKGGYEAVAILRPGVLAGVSPKRVDWFQVGGTTLRLLRTVGCDFEAIAGCFPSRRTNELIVLDVRGRIRRIPSF